MSGFLLFLVHLCSILLPFEARVCGFAAPKRKKRSCRNKHAALDLSSQPDPYTYQAVTTSSSTIKHKVGLDDPLLTPPWDFSARRIHYQFRAIPTEVSRHNCPPCRRPALSTQPIDCNDEDKELWSTKQSPSSQPPALSLLSVNDQTLGGIFIVEYTDSPIGPYREVAILSSLTARFPFMIGAWASHIFVDSYAAMHYGQLHWGLPAVVLPIEFDDDDIAATVNVSFTSNGIKVSGWRSTDDMTNPSPFWKALDIGLPSFSGCLPSTTTSDNEDDRAQLSPLLQYPLRIKQPESISLASTAGTMTVNNKSISASSSSNDDDDEEEEEDAQRIIHDYLCQVKHLLDTSQAVAAFDIYSVQLQAGIPEQIIT